LQRSSSRGTFAFGSTAEAAKPPEMHHKQVPCFNPHCLFGVGGNAESPTNYEKVASLVRDTQLSIEDDMLRLQRQRSNTWIARLEGLGICPGFSRLQGSFFKRAIFLQNNRNLWALPESRRGEGNTKMFFLLELSFSVARAQ